MALSASEKKQHAARSALKFLHDDLILGVGTGSTVNAFIELLPAWGGRLRAAVSSSSGSSARLRQLGIALADLNDVESLGLYVDGADEATADRSLIKGGGAALTREKIVAAASQRFVCIVDDSKLVTRLGRFPLPVEVIPMARNLVARQLSALGGRPVWRQSVVTDNGNHILDVHDLDIRDPIALELAIQRIVGVVEVGLFAARGADVLLVAGDEGVREI